MNIGKLLAVLVLSFCATSSVHAQVINLATLLSNGGFEDNLSHAQWTATKKNKNYRLEAPMVNPVIFPWGVSTPVTAPAWANFVGILDPADEDINGRLVHDVVSGPFPQGAIFRVSVFGNRGRLSTADSGDFPLARNEPELTFQLFG